VSARVGLAAGWLAVAATLLLAAVVLRAREDRYPDPPATERLLYLRSPALASRVMLTFDALAADVYWIRAIQHYGRDRKEPRPDPFGLLDPLLDLTTTLDPHFNMAYRFGAIFLSLPPPDGPGRPDLGVRLLEKGLRTQPDRWQYVLDIGFIHYWYTRDFEKAGEAFQRAAAMPGAPDWIRPLAAVTLARGGDRSGARQLLQNLLASATEPYLEQAARRGLSQLRALDAIDQLQTFVEQYAARNGRYPGTWQDIPELAGQSPLDDAGTPFIYNAEAHEVRLSPASELWPLPSGLEGP